MQNKAKAALRQLITSILSLIVAILISSLVIVFAGYNPLEAYKYMLNGVFKSNYTLAQTMGTAMPLIFAGLAMAVSSRVGVFNIGIEGQIIMGAFATALAGHYVTFLPRPLHLLLCLLVAVGCGGLWAMIAAVLKNRLRVSEVIITIMLNYIALFFVNYMITYPFNSGNQMVRTSDLQESARFITLVKNSRLNTGIFLALGVAVVLWFVLYKTRFGYELRAVGSNPSAAETAGINQKKCILATMFLSGAIAGLAGAGEVMGVGGYYATSMTTGYGFDGIAIAVMGMYNPFGTVLSAILFAALRIGAANMNLKTGIPNEFVKVIQSLIIIFMSTPGIILSFKQFFRKKTPAVGVKKEGN